MPENSPTPESDSRPPLGSWRRMYALVLVTEVVLVALFYSFTRYFS